MKTLLSPVEVKTLLACHCLGLEHPPAKESPATVAALQYFKKEGAVKLDTDRAQWVVTDLGRAWVKSICDTPKPEHQFVDPRTSTVLDTK